METVVSIISGTAHRACIRRLGFFVCCDVGCDQTSVTGARSATRSFTPSLSTLTRRDRIHVAHACSSATPSINTRNLRRGRLRIVVMASPRKRRAGRDQPRERDVLIESDSELEEHKRSLLLLSTQEQTSDKCNDIDEVSNASEMVDKDLPYVSRSAILGACTVTSGAMVAAGIAGRQASHWAALKAAATHDCTVLMSFHFSLPHICVAVALAIGVSVLRELLLSAWPEFREASYRSNKQVLNPLESWDLVIVSCLPGISEEFLFRGLLMPAVGVDWTGIIAAGTVFGFLHVGGGRNAASAIWATGVGVAYGAAGVWTSDLFVPVVAHSLANLIAAGVWKTRNANEQS